MTIQVIIAELKCEGCGAAFKVDIDPDSPVPHNWTIGDMVSDAVREGRLHDAEGSSVCSLRNDQHLCATCTESRDLSDDDAAYAEAGTSDDDEGDDS